MAINGDFGERLREARAAVELLAKRRITNREIGERLAPLVGKNEAIDSQVISAWFANGQEPDQFRTTVAGLAKLLGTSPAWLAFGEGERGDANGALLLHHERKQLAEQDFTKRPASKPARKGGRRRR